MGRLIACLVGLPLAVAAGTPNHDAFADATGHIATPEQVLAAQDMVRTPGQLDALFADAAKGNRRAARVFQELETIHFPNIGRAVAERTAALKCRTPVVKEFATEDCRPDWGGLDFLPRSEPGVRLRKAALDAYQARARQLGIEDAVIMATINAVLAVGGAAMVVHSAEARAATSQTVSSQVVRSASRPLPRAVFRGTSEGFPGSAGVQRIRLTPVSEDPVVATIFATEAENYGRGIVFIATEAALAGVTAVEGNVLASLEREIGLEMTPFDFARRAGIAVPASQARAILERMGHPVPASIRGPAAVDQVLRSTTRLTEPEIQTFTKEAGLAKNAR
jgi:hypothetical protein